MAPKVPPPPRQHGRQKRPQPSVDSLVDQHPAVQQPQHIPLTDVDRADRQHLVSVLVSGTVAEAGRLKRARAVAAIVPPQLKPACKFVVPARPVMAAVKQVKTAASQPRIAVVCVFPADFCQSLPDFIGMKKLVCKTLLKILCVVEGRKRTDGAKPQPTWAIAVSAACPAVTVRNVGWRTARVYGRMARRLSACPW